MKGGNTGDVSQSAEKDSGLVVDNEERTSSELVSSVSLLSLTSSDGSGLDATFNIFVGAESLEEGNGVLGLGDLSSEVIKNKRELRDLKNAMSAGKD